MCMLRSSIFACITPKLHFNTFIFNILCEIQWKNEKINSQFIYVYYYIYIIIYYILGFPGGSDGKESACNAGDLAFIPGSVRFPGEGNGYSLQYSCLENPMDRGAWWATVCGVAKSWTWLSD